MVQKVEKVLVHEREGTESTWCIQWIRYWSMDGLNAESTWCIQWRFYW